MQLVSLEINGFKSFADKTKLRFDKGVTGIVGPNGCGKSNVVDAIRWVLGEQRTRNLRSDKMENILFNGAEKRKKANFADVSITFANTRNVLPAEFTSITITRRLFRDGQSEYLLNQVPCRLKDINNLLLDTGVGPDSYAIIELKMIDELLNDKNGSRRLLFEEAAGVARYKLRKREALQRLDETDASLLRLEDVLFEVEKNLKLLEKQARRAEEFFALKEAYRQAGVRQTLARRHEHAVQLEALVARERALNDAISATLSRIAKHDARIIELNTARTRYEEQSTKEVKALNEIMQDIARHEHEKQVRKERAGYLQQRTEELARHIERAQAETLDLRGKLDAFEHAIDAENEAYDRQEFYLTELERDLEDLRMAVRNRKLQVDELSQAVKQREQRVQSYQRERDARQVKLEALRRDEARAAAEALTLQTDLAAQAAHLTAAEAEVADVHTRLEALRAQKIALRERQAEAEAELTALRQQAADGRRQLDLKTQEHDLMKNLVDTLDGHPESVVFLKRNAPHLKHAPLVSDLLNCPADYKAALETFLENYLNYYVTPTRADALAAVRLLSEAKKGRANFFILDELTPPVPVPFAHPDARSFLDFVEYDPKYAAVVRTLLQNAYVWNAAPPDVAPADVALVTADGVVISRQARVSGGSVGLFVGKRIGRVQTLERLRLDIDALKVTLEAHKTAITTQEQALLALKAQDPSAEIEVLSKELARRQQQTSGLAARAGEQRNRLGDLERHIRDTQAQISAAAGDLAKLDPQLNAAQDELNDLYQQLAAQQREWNNRNEALTQAQQTLNTEQLSFLDAKNRVANLKKDFRLCLDKINELAAAEAGWRQEQDRVAADKAALAHDEAAHDEALIQHYGRKEAQETRVRLADERLGETRNSVLQNEQFIRDERRLRDESESERTAVRDQTAALRYELKAAGDRLMVEWQIDIETVKLEDYPPAPPDIEAQVTRLRNRYLNFGEVNTTAIEAYQEVKQRHDFLSVQKKDLHDAKANLLTTIGEIDQTAEARFMEAFVQIRDNFQRVFRTLFTEDDTCDLSLAQPDNPLESPIDIMARPKGKRPLTINQLSGGEKTLTAISLLFAIYLLKPAPFCVFDEVDAPLDDANIDKFNNIINRFSADSQFIIVTHNKRTMVHTNVLYGVTMEEAGISRVLPVDWQALNLN